MVTALPSSRAFVVPAAFVKATLVGSVVLLALALERPSHAAAPHYSRDRSANEHIQRVIHEYYLQTQFERAERLLVQIVEACEDKCHASTISKAWMYVGIVRGSGRDDIEGADAAFRLALQADPGIVFDGQIASEATRLAWQQAREAVGASARDPVADDRAERGHRGDVPETRESVQAAPANNAGAAEDCPPGFPSCRSEDQPCAETSECKAGLVCAPSSDGGKKRCVDAAVCSEDVDCVRGGCRDGVCDPSVIAGRQSRHFVGLHFAADFAFIPGGRNLCSAEAQASAGARYRCFIDGNPYPDDYAQPVPGNEAAGGTIDSGIAPSTLRVLLSYGYAISHRVRGEARFGWAFLGAPRGFLPVHGELRAAYVFGDASAWLRPYALLGAGVAQIDTKMTLSVYEQPRGTSEVEKQTVDAYVSAGLLFASVAGGATLVLGDSLGLRFETSAMAMLPDAALAIQPSLGLVVGL